MEEKEQRGRKTRERRQLQVIHLFSKSVLERRGEWRGQRSRLKNSLIGQRSCSVPTQTGRKRTRRRGLRWSQSGEEVSLKWRGDGAEVLRRRGLTQAECSCSDINPAVWPLAAHWTLIWFFMLQRRRRTERSEVRRSSIPRLYPPSNSTVKETTCFY